MKKLLKIFGIALLIIMIVIVIIISVLFIKGKMDEGKAYLIASGVNTALEARNGINEQYGSIGAGDQGTMYGYATKETREMLPLPLVLSHRIVKRLDEARKGKLIKGILPDGKAQVTIEYDDDVPVRVKTIVVSVQHEKNKTQEELKSDILNNVLWQCFEDFPFDDETEILINPSGQFVLGGPAADTGLTGRKIMVDTYGGLASHGGGALCGKDPTKVDRSGAYMARYIAKHIVWCDLAEKCEVAISYAIGKANPVAFSINTFGTGTVSDEVLTIAIILGRLLSSTAHLIFVNNQQELTILYLKKLAFYGTMNINMLNMRIVIF